MTAVVLCGQHLLQVVLNNRFHFGVVPSQTAAQTNILISESVGVHRDLEYTDSGHHAPAEAERRNVACLNYRSQ